VRVLLDSNAYSLLMRGHDPAADLVRTADELLLSADRYSRIFSSLRAKGRPIPTNDVWIAAHAMETGADLLSADQHFKHVDGIAWISLDL